MLFAITYKTNNALGFDIDFRLYCGFVEFISFFFFLFLITALEVSDQMTQIMKRGSFCLHIKGFPNSLLCSKKFA